MNPVAILLVGAAYGYLAGNTKARNLAFEQLQKLSGMAIEGLSKQGGYSVQTTMEPIEPEEQIED